MREIANVLGRSPVENDSVIVVGQEDPSADSDLWVLELRAGKNTEDKQIDVDGRN